MKNVRIQYQEDDSMDDSYGEDDDLIGVNDVTSQLAAAGWQNGVHPFYLFFFCYYLWLKPCHVK